jgi:hypothetical protein
LGGNAVPAGSVAQVGPDGKPVVTQITPPQEIPVNTARRAQLVASGVIPAGSTDAWSEDANTGKLSVIPTGRTSEEAQTINNAAADAATMKGLREAGSTAQSQVNQSKLVNGLLDQFPTGPMADWKLGASRWSQALGVKLPPNWQVNAGAGEALRSSLGQAAIDQLGAFSRTSNNDVKMVKQNAGDLTTTTAGQRLLRSISDWNGQQQIDPLALAETWHANVTGDLSGKATAQNAKDNPELTPYIGKTYGQAKQMLASGVTLPEDLKQQIRGFNDTQGQIKQLVPAMQDGTLTQDQADYLIANAKGLQPSDQNRLSALVNSKLKTGEWKDR